MEGATRKILLVEDQEDDYILTRSLLREANAGPFELRWAATLEAGLQALASFTPDALLVDYDLGKENGLDFIRGARELGCAAPAILLTGHPSYDLDIEAMKTGVDEYLEKGQVNGPFLERSIRYAIERRQIQAQLQQANEALAQAKRELEARVQERTRELEERETLLRQVLEALPVGVWIIDREGKILHGNPASHKIWGGARYVGIDGYQEYKAWWVDSGLPVAPDEWAVVRAIRDGEAQLDEEIEIETFDGARKIIVNSAVPMRAPGGEITGAIVVNQDITARKWAEQSLEAANTALAATIDALRETNQLFEQIFTTIHLSIAYLDRDLRFIRVNRSYAQADGRKEEDFPGKKHFDLYPNAENELLFRRAVETGEPVYEFAKPFEYAGHPERGVTYWDWSLLPVKGANGEVTGLILSLLDVTERQRTSQALQTAETRRRAVVNGAPLILFATDETGRVTLLEGHGLARLGLTQGQGLGRPVESVLKLPAAVHQFIERALAGEEVTSIFPIQDPEEVLEVRFSPLYHAGSAVHGVIGVVTFITERVRAEAQLAYQAFLLDNVNDAIVATDLDGFFTNWNRTAEELYGWTHEEVYGRRDQEILRTEFKGVDAQAAYRLLQEAGQFQGEVVQYRKDGQQIPVEVKVTTLRDEGGKAIGYVSINRDIRRRKKAEELARQAAGRLEAQAELSRLLAEARMHIPEMLNALAQRTAELLGDACVVTLVSEDGQYLDPVAFYHVAPQENRALRELLASTRVKIGESFAGLAAERGEPLLVPELSEEEVRARLAPEVLPYLERHGIHSLLIVPVMTGDRLVGTLGVVRGRPGNPYTPEDQAFLEALASRAALSIANAVLYQAVQQELAERRRVEAELNEIQARLIDGAEAERLQLARELHDGPIQELYGIQFQLSALRAGLDDAAKNQVKGIETVTQRVIDTLRAASVELRPPELARFGLESAIRAHIDQVQKMQPDLQVDLQVSSEPPGDGPQLSERLRLALFRICQMALTNVVRHAKAGRATVRLAADAREVALEVSDDGVGFDVPERWVELARRGHLGLVGAIERVEALGGTLQVISQPGAGTTIRVRIPRGG